MVLAAQLSQGVEVYGVAEGVHGYYGFDPAAGLAVVAAAVAHFGNLMQVGSELLRIEAQAFFFAVAEMRNCPAVAERVGRSDKSKIGHEHLVTALHPAEQQADVQRGRAVGHRNGALRTGVFGQLFLKQVYVFAYRRNPARIDALFKVHPFVSPEMRLMQPDERLFTVHGLLDRLQDGFQIYCLSNCCHSENQR